MALILTVVAIFVLLCVSEFWWRRKSKHGELSRKFIHITVGSSAAFWPFYMSWDQIRLLSLGFLIGVLISKYFKVFKAIHSVQRPTWGEIFFALIAGILTFLTEDKWIFAAALLQMSLADGFAAIVGVRYGRHRYKVFGHTKSYIGTTTFFIVSILILVGFNFVAEPLPIESMAFIAACATLIENIGVRGSDNLLVPLVATLLLR